MFFAAQLDKDVIDSMTSDLLCFNSAKTEFLLLVLNLKPHNPTRLLTASARNLGLTFHSHLSFSNHISSVSRACFYHIHDLRRICHVLHFDIACTISTHLLFTPDLTIAIRCTTVFLKCSQTAFNISRMPLLMLLLQLPGPPILTIFSNCCTGSRYRNALNTKLFPPCINSFSLLPLLLHVTCVISSQSSRSMYLH